MARGVLIARCVPVAVSAFIGLEAVADGKVFARVDAERVVTPGQSALLAFTGTQETLIIETQAVGGGDDLGWIVPVPSEPQIEATSGGVFPTLRAITAPELIRHEGLGRAAVAAALVLALLAIGVFRRLSILARAIIAVVICFMLPVLLVPTLGRARGFSAPGVEAVTTRIGSYDVTTLRGDTGAAVLAWLRDNGYLVPEGATTVFDDYAMSGWRFVASRLRRDAGTSTAATIHPLLIRFATSQAVYPMRLTGVDQESPLALDLFVAGPGRARVDGMKVRWCRRVTAAEPEVDGNPGRREPRYADDGDTVIISHAALRRAITGPAVLTRLVGTLPVRSLNKDMPVRWDDYSPAMWRGFSEQGVHEVAAAATIATLVIGVLSAAVLCRRKGRRRARVAVASLLLAVAVGFAVQKFMPRLRTLEGRTNPRHLVGPAREAQGEAATAEVLREKFRAAMAYYDLDAPEGDSPGCWAVRDGPSGAEIILYDAFGSEYAYPSLVDP